MLIYANLRSPGRDPGVQSAFLFFFYFFILLFFFSFFFMSLPGRQIYIFLTLIFLFLVPSRGMKCYFLTSRKLYHMKFAIFDVARCRMSATSLTFLLLCILLFLEFLCFFYFCFVLFFSMKIVADHFSTIIRPKSTNKSD